VCCPKQYVDILYIMYCIGKKGNDFSAVQCVNVVLQKSVSGSNKWESLGTLISDKKRGEKINLSMSIKV